MLYGKQCGGVCGRVGPVVSEVGSVCWDVDEEVSPQRNPNTLLGVVLQVRYDSPKTCQTLPVCLYHLPHTHAHTHDLWTPYADLPIVVDAFHAGWHDLSPRPSPAAHLQQPMSSSPPSSATILRCKPPTTNHHVHDQPSRLGPSTYFQTPPRGTAPAAASASSRHRRTPPKSDVPPLVCVPYVCASAVGAEALATSFIMGFSEVFRCCARFVDNYATRRRLPSVSHHTATAVSHHTYHHTVMCMPAALPRHPTSKSHPLNTTYSVSPRGAARTAGRPCRSTCGTCSGCTPCWRRHCTPCSASSTPRVFQMQGLAWATPSQRAPSHPASPSPCCPAWNGRATPRPTSGCVEAALERGKGLRL